MPRHRRPRYHPSAPGHPEQHGCRPCRPRPEPEEHPSRHNTAQRVRTIERWLHHAEEELRYAPEAAEEAAATPLEARYSLRWGAGDPGGLAIEPFPLDARHPLTQQPYGAYAVGEVLPLR